MQSNYFKISICAKQEEGIHYAYCSGLPGCYSQGDSYEELKKNIQEAVDLYLESLTEHEAIECLGKPTVEDAGNTTFDIQLKLTSAQAETLLLKAGFSQTANKENNRIFSKKNLRIILPMKAEKNLPHKIVKEILDLVEA